MGTLSEPVPVTGLAENFSPIPLMAPPPLGSDMAGGDEGMPSVGSPRALSPLEPADPSVPAESCHGSVEDRSVPFMKVSPCYRLLPCKLLSQLNSNRCDEFAMNFSGGFTRKYGVSAKNERGALLHFRLAARA